MTNVLKYLRGYVRIRVWGLAPQRFINLCSNKGILLWDIRKQDEIYSMCVSLEAFYRLRPIVRKTKVRVVISARYGLPFLLPGMWKRRAFFIGLLFAAGFWILSSLYVWDVQVDGNTQVTDDLFYRFLAEEGIHTGMLQSRLDIAQLEKEIRRTFPEVTWTSGRLEGTRLLIEIKENDMPKPQTVTVDDNTGQDIVATADGVITEILVRSGVPQVTAGSEVAKGDVLVSGKIPIYAEDGTVREYSYVTADADLLIEHERQFRATLALDYVKPVYTGRERRRYFLRIGNREWSLAPKLPFLHYDSIRTDDGGKTIFGMEVYREYQNTEYVYTREEAKRKLTEKITDFYLTLSEKGVQIISKDVKIETNGKKMTLHGELTVREAAWKLSATEIEDINIGEEQ